MRQYLAYHRF